MGNQSSFMEKVYVYLPVLMCHSRMDYEDKSTMWNIRTAYFAEQIGIFAFTVYFVFAIRKSKDRKILVPDISYSQVLTNNIPKPDQLMYRRTTYFKHEMTEVFRQLQQLFVAFMLTILAHFILGFRPVLLLQIFSAPYHFSENRLLRKFILGLKPGYRIWGERFEGEIDDEKIVKEEGEEGEEDEGEDRGGNELAVVGATAAAGGEADGGEQAADGVQTVALPARDVSADPEAEGAEGSLPMPTKLEDRLIEAWEAAEEGDWGAVMEEVGPISVNTQTPVGKWSPLMVACGLSQAGEGDIKTLIEDLDARVDLQDQDGWTCLHWAAQQGRAVAGRAVLEAIASLASGPDAAAAAVADLRSIRDKEGKTAAEVARGAGLESEALAELLGVLENA